MSQGSDIYDYDSSADVEMIEYEQFYLSPIESDSEGLPSTPDQENNLASSRLATSQPIRQITSELTNLYLRIDACGSACVSIVPCSLPLPITVSHSVSAPVDRPLTMTETAPQPNAEDINEVMERGVPLCSAALPSLASDTLMDIDDPVSTPKRITPVRLSKCRKTSAPLVYLCVHTDCGEQYKNTFLLKRHIHSTKTYNVVEERQDSNALCMPWIGGCCNLS
jgi:hypothetical protein